MRLIYMEHKKLWDKKIVRLSVCICFIYIVVFGSVLTFQWFTYGSTKDITSVWGKHFDGYSMIRKEQEHARLFNDQLTDDTLQALVRDYQQIERSGNSELLRQTDWEKVNQWLGTLYPELKDSDIYNVMISYVNPEQLTGLYERRQAILEEFLEVNNQTGDEKDYLLEMDQRVQKPFRYEWMKGWENLLGSISEYGMVMALSIAIALSSLFAGEWHNNTCPLVLTMKNGWKMLGIAKIITGILFTIELYLLVAIPSILSQIFFMGTSGWDMPIQNIKLIAVAPLNMLQAEVYEYIFTLLGIIGFAGIVMLFSAAVKNNVLSLLLSLAVVYGPMIIAGYLPYHAQKAVDLLPLVGSSMDIFRTNTFHIFGRYVWSPYLLLIVPVVIGVLCMPMAVSKWAKRMRR